MDREVSAQAHRPEVAVDHAVQLEPTELPTLPGNPQSMVAALGKEVHRLFQSCRLFGSGLEGAAKREGLHTGILAHHAKGGRAALQVNGPVAEARGIRAAEF